MDDWVNKALITKSLIYNASLIVEDKKYFKSDRFFDFSALCEAVILFDELKALDSSNVLPEYSLPKKLVDNGILNNFSPIFSRDEVKRIIENMPGFLVEFSTDTFWEMGVDPKLKNLETDYYDTTNDDSKKYHGISPYQIDDVRPRSEDSGCCSYYRECGYSVEHHVFVTSDNLKNNSLDKLMDWLHTLIYYPSLPDNIRASQSYIYRSAGYLLVSHINNVDYYPDFLRVPYIASYIDRAYKSVPRELYQRISELLEFDIKEIDDHIKSTTFPIPPFTALALDEAKSCKQLPSVLLDMRSDFKSFRDKLSKIDRDIKNSESIEDKKKAINKKKELLEDVSSNYKNSEIISFKEGLNYSMELVAPAIKPTDPTSYSTAILCQPIEWIKKWWLRRPITSLYRVDKKVRKIAGYNNLVQKIWDRKIDISTGNDYNSHGKAIEMIFDKF
ncbi:MAG: hypothetical protein PHF18_16875 [Methanosarcina sp.]|uniref:hypothetical protein n=1 Tax=Methanosarcina sp. TaxID=2213 RepID=UPI002610278F|nr:hypothetical protein [Methanosarcina sp.]MDD3248505.1 hypothetical protein [Methanosarcina sp.]MDD4249145.1 hypothetical protein [Methanosarcina sp.]